MYIFKNLDELSENMVDVKCNPSWNSAKVEIVLFVNCINCSENKSSVDLKAVKACFELRIRRNNG